MTAKRKKTAAATPAPGPAQWWVEVVPYEKGSEINHMGPFTSERLAERCEGGVERNLNHECFYTRIVSGDMK